MVTAVEAVFVAWFLATAVAQGRFRCVAPLRRLGGPAGLLAGWNLFSPTPVVADVLVDARALDHDGGAGPWVPVVHPTPRRWRDALLCVERRATKAVFDSAVAIVRLAQNKVSPEVLVTRRCYVTVLHLATEASHATAGGLPLVQFRIVHVTYEGGVPADRVVFQSRPHRRARRPSPLAPVTPAPAPAAPSPVVQSEPPTPPALEALR